MLKQLMEVRQSLKVLIVQKDKVKGFIDLYLFVYDPTLNFKGAYPQFYGDVNFGYVSSDLISSHAITIYITKNTNIPACKRARKTISPT